MNDPNQAYGGNIFEQPASNLSEVNGWEGSSGYGYDNNIAQPSSDWGVGDTAFNTDRITNPYAENPYEVNVFDNAYTETFSNPNPTQDYSSHSGFELE